MTTDELVQLIEQDAASHRLHDCEDVHPYQAPIVTIGSLFVRAGCTRRAVEEAIQQARLEGVPIITDGGIRVAQTSAEAFGLYRWLRARLVTQQRTAWSVRSQAMLMQRGERTAAAVERIPDRDAAWVEPTLWGEAA